MVVWQWCVRGCGPEPPPPPSPFLQGSVSVGDSIELPALKLSKQVRSMQMFKRPMTKVMVQAVAGCSARPR